MAAEERGEPIIFDGQEAFHSTMDYLNNHGIFGDIRAEPIKNLEENNFNLTKNNLKVHFSGP